MRPRIGDQQRLASPASRRPRSSARRPRAASARLIERPRSAAARADRRGARTAALAAARASSSASRVPAGPAPTMVDGVLAHRQPTRSSAAPRLDAAPDVREAVVQRHGRQTDDVRLAPVVMIPAAPERSNTAARVRPPPRTRSDSWQPRAADRRRQHSRSRSPATRASERLQVGSQLQRLGRSASCRRPNTASEASSGAAERIGGLLTCQPAAPGRAGERGRHAKACGRFVTPPARQARQR